MLPYDKHAKQYTCCQLLPVAIIANPFQFKSKWQTDVLQPLNAHSTLRFDRRNEIVVAQEISTPSVSRTDLLCEGKDHLR